MSCPMGYESIDGVNPHLVNGDTMPSVFDAAPSKNKKPKPQRPQSDGRIAPPLPPRPHGLRAPRKPYDTVVVQGPIPAWARFISGWYNYFWAASRTSIIALFFVVFVPYFHLLSFLCFRLPLSLPFLLPLCEYLLYPAFRAAQRLHTGVVVCFFESMSKTRFSFSGKVSNSFWLDEEYAVYQAKAAAAAAAEGSPTSASSSSPTTKPSSSSATKTSSDGLVNIYVSNQTAYTSFVDSFVFFCLNYRRKQYSNLYFLPIDLKGWSLFGALLHALFLGPLTISSKASMDLLRAYTTARGKEISLVWFPELTTDADAMILTPVLGSASSLSQDLLHVHSPRLSQLFVNTVASTVCSGAAKLNVVECTLSYTGSVQAELEAKYEEDMALNCDSAALTDAEEEEFEESLKKSNFTEADVDETSMEGYSAETINEAAHGTITSQLKRKYEPRIPVFCTAAPLQEVDLPKLESSNASNSFPRSTHNASNRAALLRKRVVPSYHSFLSGNPPSTVHVLLNELNEEYFKSRVIAKPATANGKANGKKQKSSEDENQSSLASSLDSWLHQRFMHQELQLSLFAVHSCFHALPTSLSASSIPISTPLESFSFPVSTVWASAYAIADWVLIVFTVVVARGARNYLNQFKVAF